MILPISFKPLLQFTSKVIIVNFDGSAAVIGFGSFGIHELNMQQSNRKLNDSE